MLNVEDQYGYRNELLNQYIKLALFVSICLSPLYYYLGIYSLAVLLILFFFSMIILRISSKKISRFILNSRLFMVFISILFIGGFINGNQEIDSKYFLLLYPIASFSIRGPKEGIFLSFMMLLIFIGIYIKNPSIYNLYSFIFFAIAYLMVSYLLYYYRFYEILNFIRISKSLEDKITKRTQELSLQVNKLKEKEDELTLANQKIGIANNEKSRFLAAASHDLRQPVHAMGFQIEKCKLAFKEPETLKQIDSLSNCHHVLTQSINTLMDISKLDSGIIEVKKVYFPVQTLFDNLNTELMPYAKNKGISLRFRHTTQRIFTDPEQLHLVFSNVIGNAIKFTDKKGVLVACRSQGTSLSLEVWDTGSGIPKDKIEEVFKEYTQLNNPGQNQNQSLGLGLSIVKRICNLLELSFSLQSKSSKGTSFKLKIPRANEAQKQFAEINPSASFSLQGSLILLIDDDEEILHTTSDLLKSWQCAVIAVKNIKNALEQATGEEISLIIADYQLYGKETGLEAIHRVNQILDNHTQAIIVTGESDPDILKKITQAGYPVLQKPLSPAMLRSSIHKFLSNLSNTKA